MNVARSTSDALDLGLLHDDRNDTTLLLPTRELLRSRLNQDDKVVPSFNRMN